MKKIFVWATLIVLIVITVWFINYKKDDGLIKIGVVAPLKGGAAVYGDNLVKGIQLALEDMGEDGKKYKLIVEDDETNPAKSASAAQKLINVDKVSAIITTTSGTGNAVQPIAENAGVIHICDCVDLRITKGKTGFIYLIQPEQEAIAWLREAQSSGVKKLTVLSVSHPGVNAILEALKKHVSEYGIEIVNEQQIDASSNDFKTVVAKSKAYSSDIYLILMYPPAIEILGRELKTQGIEKVASFGLLAISSDLSVFNNKWYTDNYLSDPNYSERFSKEYPGTRFNVRTAPHGYDILNIIVSGIKTGDPVSYVTNMTRYDGKVGLVTKKVGEKAFNMPIGIWQIKDGKPELLKKIDIK